MTDQPRSKGGFDLKDYVEVKDRIRLFYEKWPTGALVTGEVRISVDDDTPRVIVQAFAYRTPDDPHPGIGWSWLELPGKTSYTKGSELENAETSAWGRAIGSLGIGIDKSIASPDEIKTKAGAAAGEKPPSVESVEGGLIGIASVGKTDSAVDGQLRVTPDGLDTVGFVLGEGREKVQVVARGELATVIAPLLDGFMGERVQVYGPVTIETMRVGKYDKRFPRLALIQIKTADFTLPAPNYQMPGAEELAAAALEADSVPLFTEGEWAGV